MAPCFVPRLLPMELGGNAKNYLLGAHVPDIGLFSHRPAVIQGSGRACANPVSGDIRLKCRFFYNSLFFGALQIFAAQPRPRSVPRAEFADRTMDKPCLSAVGHCHRFRGASGFAIVCLGISCVWHRGPSPCARYTRLTGEKAQGLKQAVRLGGCRNFLQLPLSLSQRPSSICNKLLFYLRVCMGGHGTC